MVHSGDRLAPPRRPAFGHLLLLCAILCAPALAHGQAQGQDLETLLEEVRRLEERIEALEAPEARPGLGLSASYGDLSATFQIFSDVGSEYRNPDTDGDANTIFAQGSAAFFATAQMGDNFRVLSETVIDGDSSASQERLWGSWAFGDELYAKLGTEHSSVSRWNQLNHHGRWLETTIMRPYLARFEGDGGFLPLHRTGIELGGTLSMDSGRIEYFGTVSNGRGLVPSDKQRATDVDDEKDIDIGIAFMPEAIPDLRVGAAVQFGHIPEDSSSSNPLRARSIDENIVTGHVEYRIDELEISSEFAAIDHEAFNGKDFGHSSGYLQLAYSMGDWTPYARIDYRNMRENDPFYTSQDRDLDAWMQIVGLRYELAQNAAVKWELGVGEEEFRDSGGNVSEDSVFSFAVQLAWWL